MDSVESGWILEFLARQNSVDNETLNELIRVLPVPDDNPRLKTSLILRKIESDIEKGTISETTVELLEQIRGGRVEICEGLDVSEVLGRHVNEVKQQIGPPFLELACDTILSDATLAKTIMGLTTHNNQIPPTSVIVPRHKPVIPPCPTIQTHGGENIVERHTLDTISTPAVTKLQQDLRTSCLELHAVVKDPLPEALLFAQSLKANTSKESNDTEIVDLEASIPSHIRKGKAPQVDDGVLRNQDTLELSDTEGSPKRPHLSSPRKRPVSPLSPYKMPKLVKQRQRKRWTAVEEDTLRTGVQKYGKGNWKLILNIYRDIFQDRTEVDLKDKWRNLTR